MLNINGGSYSAKNVAQNAQTILNWSFLRAIQAMEHKNQPENIPEWYLEKTIQEKGAGVLFKHDDGKFYFLPSNLTVKPDYMFIPTKNLAVNPFILNADGTSLNKELTLGEDCVLFKNNDLMLPTTELISPYASVISETRLTQRCLNILSRAQLLLNAKDDKAADALRLFLEGLENGNLAALFGGKSIIVDEAIQNLGSSSASAQEISYITELESYLNAKLLNEIGVSSQLTHKKEYVNEDELQQDDLLIITDNQLRNRKKSIEDAIKIWPELSGWTCEKRLIWKSNEAEILGTKEVKDDGLQTEENDA